MSWRNSLGAQAFLASILSFFLAFTPTLRITSGSTKAECYVGHAHAGSCSTDGIAACGEVLTRVNRGECDNDGIILGTETATSVFETIEPLIATVYAVIVISFLIDAYARGSGKTLKRTAIVLRLACGPASSAIVHYLGLLYAHTSVNNNSVTPGLASVSIAMVPLASLAAAFL